MSGAPGQFEPYGAVPLGSYRFPNSTYFRPRAPV